MVSHGPHAVDHVQILSVISDAMLQTTLCYFRIASAVCFHTTSCPQQLEVMLELVLMLKHIHLSVFVCVPLGRHPIAGHMQCCWHPCFMYGMAVSLCPIAGHLTVRLTVSGNQSATGCAAQCSCLCPLLSVKVCNSAVAWENVFCVSIDSCLPMYASRLAFVSGLSGCLASGICLVCQTVYIKTSLGIVVSSICCFDLVSIVTVALSIVAIVIVHVFTQLSVMLSRWY